MTAQIKTLDCKIYEVGNSVRRHFSGEEKPNKPEYKMVVLAEKLSDVADQITKFGKVYTTNEKEQYVTGEMRFSDKQDNDKKVKMYGKWFRVDDIETFLSTSNFTINAMAIDYSDGSVIDPFGGQDDIENKILRLVGEDLFVVNPIQIFEAMKLVVQLDYNLDQGIVDFLSDEEKISVAISSLSKEEMRSKLVSIFSYDTLEALKFLERFPYIREELFFDNVLKLYPVNESLRD